MMLKDEEDQASTSSSQSTIVTETTSTRSGRLGRNTIRRHDSTQSLNLLAGAALGQAALQQQGHPSKRGGCTFRALMNERALSGGSSRSTAWGESAYVADTEESALRALWNVIKFAQHQNPKEFELPKDLLPGIKLPGSYKTLTERRGKLIIELENGMIPRPVRRCFVCSRTCMFAPLLPCDYCSCCFHLDCLDPPLSQFPPRSDRWMCQNHVEHVVDRYLVRSIRLTERLRIWSDLTKVFPDSQSTTTTTYSSGDPDAPSLEAETATKPEPMDTVSECASDSTELQAIDLATESSRPSTPPINLVAPYDLTYGPDEEAAILADLMRKVQRGRSERSAVLSSIVGALQPLVGDQTDSLEVGPHLQGRRLWRITKALAPNTRTAWVDSSRKRIVVPPAVKSMYARGVRRLPRPSEVKSVDTRSNAVEDTDKQLFVRGLLEFYMKRSPTVSDPTNIPPMKESEQIALTCPGEQVTPTIEAASTVLSGCSTSTETKEKDALMDILLQLKHVGSCSDGSSPEKKTKLDLPLVYSLAEQRVRQLLGQTESPTIPRSPPMPSVDMPSGEPTGASLLRARAVFTPCGETSGPIVRMRYRQLTVGTSPDCHICLTDYNSNTKPAQSLTKCHFASAHHATVFYDEWTQHFELINYSEFGTRVDGITYGNDVAEKEAYMPKACGKVDRVRRLIRRESTEDRENSGPSGHSTQRHRIAAPRSRNCASNCSCDCTSQDINGEDLSGLDGGAQSVLSDPPIAGWEGSAILRHGSLVQFGCYKFVLGLVDPTPAKKSCPLKRPVTKPLMIT